MATSTAGAASRSRRAAGWGRASELARARRVRTSSVTSRDGTRLAVRSAGPPDGPVVVLVHGLGLSVESWDGVTAALAPTHRVITYDLRGHGESGRAVGGDYSLDAHADDLAAVLSDAVPAGAAPVVAGHSLGGPIILAHARAHAHADADGAGEMAGAVFVGSGGSAITVPGLPGRRLPGWARRRLRTAWYGVLRGATVLGRRIRRFRRLTDTLARLTVFRVDAPGPAVSWARAEFLSTPETPLAATALTSVDRDGVELAPALAVPTVVLHGDRDKQVTDKDVRRLMEALPEAELATVEGAGHMLLLTHPGVVAQHIERWVRVVGRS